MLIHLRQTKRNFSFAAEEKQRGWHKSEQAYLVKSAPESRHKVDNELITLDTPNEIKIASQRISDAAKD